MEKTKKFEMRALDVVQDKIIGTQTDDKKLYMVVWQRVANSGIIYVWGKDENDAYNRVGFCPKFIKHTVVEINPKSMPVEVGVKN